MNNLPRVVMVDESETAARRTRDDAWPVRRQTYGYLPSRRASLPLDQYQLILLGDRGTCVLTTCPGLLWYMKAKRPLVELGTFRVASTTR